MGTFLRHSVESLVCITENEVVLKANVKKCEISTAAASQKARSSATAKLARDADVGTRSLVSL